MMTGYLSRAFYRFQPAKGQSQQLPIHMHFVLLSLPYGLPDKDRKASSLLVQMGLFYIDNRTVYLGKGLGTIVNTIVYSLMEN